jgi:hypothetical protein
VPRLEVVKTTQNVEHCFLYEVSSIETASRGRRQPAMRPSSQIGEAPLQEGFDRLSVSAARAYYELDRWLVAEQRIALGPFIGRSCEVLW